MLVAGNSETVGSPVAMGRLREGSSEFATLLINGTSEVLEGRVVFSGMLRMKRASSNWTLIAAVMAATGEFGACVASYDLAS